MVVLSHDHWLRKMMRTTLAELGLRTYTDEPREGTLQSIITLQPGLIILDVEFAYQHLAWPVLRAVKEHPATRHIPVVVCASAPWLLEDQRELIERHMVRTLSAPYDMWGVMHAVEAAFSNSE